MTDEEDWTEGTGGTGGTGCTGGTGGTGGTGFTGGTGCTGGTGVKVVKNSKYDKDKWDDGVVETRKRKASEVWNYSEGYNEVKVRYKNKLHLPSGTRHKSITKESSREPIVP